MTWRGPPTLFVSSFCNFCCCNEDFLTSLLPEVDSTDLKETSPTCGDQEAGIWETPGASAKGGMPGLEWMCKLISAQLLGS